MDEDVPLTIWSEDDISPEFLPPPTLLDCKVGRLVRLRLIVSCTTELSSLEVITDWVNFSNRKFIYQIPHNFIIIDPEK